MKKLNRNNITETLQILINSVFLATYYDASQDAIFVFTNISLFIHKYFCLFMVYFWILMVIMLIDHSIQAFKIISYTYSI